MLLVKILIICILYINLEIYAADIQIKLEGLNDVLSASVRTKLIGIKNTNVNIDQYFQNKIVNAVYSGLRPLGYYSPNIKFFLYQSSFGRDNYILLIQINPGNPIKISRVNIITTGDIYCDNDYQQLLVESKSFVGQVLNHSVYDNFKNKLLNLSLSKGYFDAKFRKSELLISPLDYQSFWNINFDSGSRYFFGETTFYGGQVKKQYLKNLCNIQPGMYYDNKFLIEFNRRLFSTDWFDSVVISQNFFASKKTKSVPIEVLLVPSVISNFKMSMGYSSDVFIRLKIVWTRPCLNIYGHSFENVFGVSMLEQFVDLSYKIPLMRCPLYEYYLLQTGIRHDTGYNGQFGSMVRVDIARYWDSNLGWKRAFKFHWCYDYCDHWKNSKSIMLIYPGFTINKISYEGGMMPVWGHSQRYSVEISHTLWKSYTNFCLLQSQNAWIRTLFCKHRLVIRNNFRWIVGNDLQSIFPFVRRFFFVSDNSIRGYNYQSLFFKNILLYPLFVSSKLIISSLEYQYNILGKWWVASFFDCGAFLKNVNHGSYWRCGMGIGMRWQSPVGPVKLDIAVPLFNKEENISKLLRVYVGLGPEL